MKISRKVRRRAALLLPFALGGLAALAPLSCRADSALFTSYAPTRPNIGPGYGPTGPDSTFAIYGTVDEYIDHYNSSGQTATRLGSGGALTSKFGIYGRENLGGGVSAHFRLESGFNGNNGTLTTANNLFSRYAMVGVNSPTWGTLDLGEQYSVALSPFTDPFVEVPKFSPFVFLGSVADLGRGASAIEPRVANSVVYSTPDLQGFTAQMLYAFKGDQGIGPQVQNRGIRANYSNGSFFASLSYNQTWCDPAQGTCTDPSIRTDYYGAAVVYNIGHAGLIGSYELYAPRYWQDLVARKYSLGALMTIGQNFLRASVVYRDTTQPGNHALGLQLGEDYALSKRTSLYVRVSEIKNGSQSQLTNDLTVLPAKGGSVTDLALGIQHSF
jgi:predicted porin